MISTIDETELARLEALACAAGDADYSAHDDADDSTKYAAAACNAVPALIAEIRRLRRNYECSEKSLQRHEHMVAELMDKVDVLEWFVEVHSFLLWRGAEKEMWEIFTAAREAVHAYRK